MMEHSPVVHFAHIKTTPEQVFVGLTGGIGSGKSAVAELLRIAGYTVFSADDIGRELTNSHPEIRRRIEEVFGIMYTPEGTIDRMKMATRVFGTTPAHAQALAALNAIIHPFVWQTVAERAKQAFARGEQVVFNETALLFETGAASVYDVVVVVDAPEEVRIHRLSEGRNIPADEARRRIQAQIPVAEKRAQADYIIENGGTPEDLRRAVEELLQKVRP